MNKSCRKALNPLCNLVSITILCILLSVTRCWSLLGLERWGQEWQQQEGRGYLCNVHVLQIQRATTDYTAPTHCSVNVFLPRCSAPLPEHDVSPMVSLKCSPASWKYTVLGNDGSLRSWLETSGFICLLNICSKNNSSTQQETTILPNLKFLISKINGPD